MKLSSNISDTRPKAEPKTVSGTRKLSHKRRSRKEAPPGPRPRPHDAPPTPRPPDCDVKSAPPAAHGVRRPPRRSHAPSSVKTTPPDPAPGPLGRAAVLVHNASGLRPSPGFRSPRRDPAPGDVRPRPSRHAASAPPIAHVLASGAGRKGGWPARPRPPGPAVEGRGSARRPRAHFLLSTSFLPPPAPRCAGRGGRSGCRTAGGRDQSRGWGADGAPGTRAAGGSKRAGPDWPFRAAARDAARLGRTQTTVSAVSRPGPARLLTPAPSGLCSASGVVAPCLMLAVTRA